MHFIKHGTKALGNTISVTIIMLFISGYSYADGNDFDRYVDQSDVAETAKAMNLDVDDVKRATDFQNKFYSYIQEWNAKFEGRISFAWVDPVPNTRGYIRFKGKAPKEILDIIGNSDFFTSENTQVFENANFSMNQTKERLMRTGLYMQNSGIKDFSIGYDHVADKIVVTIYGNDNTFKKLRNSVSNYVSKIKSDLNAQSLSDIVVIIDDHNSQSIDTQALLSGGGNLQMSAFGVDGVWLCGLSPLYRLTYHV